MKIIAITLLTLCSLTNNAFAYRMAVGGNAVSKECRYINKSTCTAAGCAWTDPADGSPGYCWDSSSGSVLKTAQTGNLVTPKVAVKTKSDKVGKLILGKKSKEFAQKNQNPANFVSGGIYCHIDCGPPCTFIDTDSHITCCSKCSANSAY